MKELTVKYLLENFNTVYTAVEYANSLNMAYPIKPKKPLIKANHSVKELAEYSSQYVVYSKELEEFRIKINEYDGNQKYINNIIVEYIKERAELNLVPAQYRDKVYDHAWQNGHSGGYSEVYNLLSELVDIFT